jgi:hypothetical protein
VSPDKVLVLNIGKDKKTFILSIKKEFLIFRKEGDHNHTPQGYFKKITLKLQAEFQKPCQK